MLDNACYEERDATSPKSSQGCRRNWRLKINIPKNRINGKTKTVISVPACHLRMILTTVKWTRKITSPHLVWTRKLKKKKKFLFRFLTYQKKKKKKKKRGFRNYNICILPPFIHSPKQVNAIRQTNINLTTPSKKLASTCEQWYKFFLPTRFKK